MKHNTDDIINSINGINKAPAPDQFYAGLRAKMARLENSSAVNRHPSSVIFLRPVFITALLFIFLVTNIIVLTTNKEKANEPANTSADLKGFAEAYNLNSNSFAQ